MKDIREGEQVSDTQKSLNEWLEDAGNTLFDRGIEYGDPRHNFLRIYKIARALGIQLRDPSDLALIAIATKTLKNGGKSRARRFVSRSHWIRRYLGSMQIFYTRRLG
jgi:hypothetical protein